MQRNSASASLIGGISRTPQASQHLLIGPLRRPCSRSLSRPPSCVGQRRFLSRLFSFFSAFGLKALARSKTRQTTASVSEIAASAPPPGCRRPSSGARSSATRRSRTPTARPLRSVTRRWSPPCGSWRTCRPGRRRRRSSAAASASSPTRPLRGCASASASRHEGSGEAAEGDRGGGEGEGVQDQATRAWRAS
jgi:hypothetical protein